MRRAVEKRLRGNKVLQNNSIKGMYRKKELRGEGKHLQGLYLVSL